MIRTAGRGSGGGERDKIIRTGRIMDASRSSMMLCGVMVKEVLTFWELGPSGIQTD